MITFIFVALFTLALSQALSPDTAAAIQLKNAQEVSDQAGDVDYLPGIDGAVGPMGPQGERGLTGAPGPQGIQGVQGETGIQGIQGETGTQGIQGETGTAGATGGSGATGATGAVGPIGPMGPVGPQGPAGSSDIPVQRICVDKKSTVYWGSCEEVDVKGTDYQIFAKN